MTDRHQASEEDRTGSDDHELIQSGVHADRDTLAAAMPAADFDQRASEAQNDEKEADQEPEGDPSLPPSVA